MFLDILSQKNFRRELAICAVFLFFSEIAIYTTVRLNTLRPTLISSLCLFMKEPEPSFFVHKLFMAVPKLGIFILVCCAGKFGTLLGTHWQNLPLSKERGISIKSAGHQISLNGKSNPALHAWVHALYWQTSRKIEVVQSSEWWVWWPLPFMVNRFKWGFQCSLFRGRVWVINNKNLLLLLFTFSK